MLTAKWAARTHAFQPRRGLYEGEWKLATRRKDEHLMMHEVTLCGRWFEARYVLRTGSNVDAVDCERCQDSKRINRRTRHEYR